MGKTCLLYSVCAVLYNCNEMYWILNMNFHYWNSFLEKTTISCGVMQAVYCNHVSFRHLSHSLSLSVLTFEMTMGSLNNAV